MSSVSRVWIWYALALSVVGLDQWTKILATANLQYGTPVEILPVFNLTLLHNLGAAFSFLNDAGGWQRWFFTVIALGASIFISVWLYRLPKTDRLLAWALALILGGALGNLWDRVQYGYVVDFISVHYQQYYFPAFNLADAAITLGAIFLIIDSVCKSRQEMREKKEESKESRDT